MLKTLGAVVAGDRQSATKWLVVCVIVLLDIAWILVSDFSFNVQSAVKVVGVVTLLLAIGWFYRVKRPMENFEVMCTETALLLAFSTAGAVLSYLVTSLNFPLIDPWLLKSDAAMGFDWLKYAGLVYSTPWLATSASVVYITTISQIALCVVVIGLSGDIIRSRRLGAAVIFSGLICIGTSGILPSAGAMGFLRPSHEFIAMGSPIVDLNYKQVFFDLRSGAERLISLDALYGLIAFPSYHGTLSALVVISLWSVRYLRFIALPFNVLVLAATPAEGGHHLTDTLAGVAVALLAWHLAGVFARKVPAVKFAPIATEKPSVLASVKSF